MAGLKEYFNVTLGSSLLYKFERLQYADVRANYFFSLINVYNVNIIFDVFIWPDSERSFWQNDESNLRSASPSTNV